MTRIIYLEDPDTADCRCRGRSRTQQELFRNCGTARIRWTLPIGSVGRWRSCAWAAACRTPPGPDAAFLFGSPPFLRFTKPHPAADNQAAGGTVACGRQRPRRRGDLPRRALRFRPLPTQAFAVEPAERISAEASSTMTHVPACNLSRRMRSAAVRQMCRGRTDSAVVACSPCVGRVACRRPGRARMSGQGPLGPPTLPPEAFAGGPGDRYDRAGLCRANRADGPIGIPLARDAGNRLGAAGNRTALARATNICTTVAKSDR